MNVKLIHATLDTFRVAPGQDETFILRGVIDPQTLDGLLVDTYQREVLGGEKMGELKHAHMTSTVPDIELGMRGERVRWLDDKQGIVTLLDPVYIVDGFQRVSAARSLVAEDAKATPRIGATIYLGTDFDWERKRFRILNQARTKVSVNVLLRNAQTDFKSVDMIAKLCQDDGFALAGRIQWQQNRLRAEVLSALTLCRVAYILHGRFGTTSENRANYEAIATSLDKVMGEVGRTTMRDNIKAFFDLLDECFGVRKIVFSHGAIQIKDTFLTTLAEVFSDYKEFWKGSKFSPDRSLRLKIAKFPIGDPEVVRLGGAGGKAREILYQLFIDHINSGKRSKRLRQDSLESADTEEEPADVGAGK